jgi:hypothetical protein
MSGQDAHKLKDMLEMPLQRFLMLGINHDSYNAAVWVTSKFLRALNSWWLNRKTQAAILDTIDSLVT